MSPLARAVMEARGNLEPEDIPIFLDRLAKAKEAARIDRLKQALTQEPQ